MIGEIPDDVERAELDLCSHGYRPAQTPSKQTELDRLTQENADLKARVERLETALKASAGLIEGEFCSHSDPHAEGNRNCWTEFIYKALHSPPMREGKD